MRPNGRLVMKWLFDIKYAYRMLLKNPGFTGLTVSVMAAGLGLCLFMLAFITSVITRPLPFEQGKEMYVIDSEFEGILYNGGSMLLQDYQEIKQQSTSYSEIGAYYHATANLSNGDRAQRFSGIVTESNMFEFTSTQPILGRGFSQQDAITGAPDVTVISYDVWKNYFNKDSNLIGNTVKVNGLQTEIIGVMPQGYKFPMAAQLWLPLKEDASRLKRNEAPNVSIFVKKKPEVSLAVAQQELIGIMKVLEKRYPETNSKTSAHINTFQKNMMGNGTELIMGLMVTSVSFILLLACINVGNLLLARANERAKETAIRVALGAPKARLMMQMMWESAVICLLGGLFGLFSAAWGLELLEGFFPKLIAGPVPYWWQIHLDTELIAKSFIIILVTAFVTGIVPAWKMTRSDFNAVLRDGTRGAMGKRAGRINRVLVILEVALSCILLSLSGVLFVILQEANNANYGADISHKLQARVGLPTATYAEDHKKQQYFNRLVKKLTAIPGVNKAGAISALPGSGAGLSSFVPEGYEVTNNQYPRSGMAIATQDTMAALDIKLVEGRYFGNQDQQDTLPVTIITESMAKKYFPDSSPLGKRIKFIEDENAPWLTIVGVVNHVIHGQPYDNVKNRPTAYRPFTQEKRRFMSIFIDVEGQPHNYTEALINAVASIDPEVPAYSLQTLQEDITQSTGGMSFVRDLFGVFALCALLLASSGIYGVISNSTSRRTQEIGIRRAIGATDEKVMSMLMKQGWLQLAIGIVIGLPVSFIASQGLVQLIGPETNHYYLVFIAIPAVICLVVSLATFVPAKRAIKLEPSSALRYE